MAHVDTPAEVATPAIPPQPEPQRMARVAHRLYRIKRAFTQPAYVYIQEDELPCLEDVRRHPDPLVRIKLFAPSGSATWYLTGYDLTTGIVSGAAFIFDFEEGDSSMAELLALKVPPFGLPIERDVYWTPRPMSQVRKEHAR